MLELPESILSSLYIGFFFGFLLSSAAIYVLLGLALTSLCRASGKGSVWMAWVPFANLYLLGLSADVYTEDRALRGEVAPHYAPSLLRRRMLGFSLAKTVVDGIVGTASLFAVAAGFSGFLLALFGGFSGNTAMGDGAKGLLSVFVVSVLIALASAAVAVLFRVLYLLSACKAYHRLFIMLNTPVPVLWAVSLIFMPPLPTVMLFIFTIRNRETLTEKFFPPIQESDAVTKTEGEVPLAPEPPTQEPCRL